MSSYTHGHFSWVDLMSRDMSGAKEFYGELFGWEAADQDTQGGPPYACFTMDGQQVAGLGEMNDEMKSGGVPPVWNSYLNVDDVKRVTDKATELGAKVLVPPFQIMEAGHMAVLQDPAGASISLWQKIQHSGAQLVNDPNSWVWNELVTSEPDKAIKFYGDLFGWTIEKDDSSPNNYWICKNGQRMNGGLMEMPPEMQGVPAHWAVYFAVADIERAMSKVKQLGGAVMREPFEVSVGHIGVVADRQGAAFQLIQLTVPPDA